MQTTTETTSHYVLIDFHTGYVWGETDATSLIAACQQVDREIDPSAPEGRTYEDGGDRHSGQDGYLVYVAPIGWTETTDGQVQSEIDRVVAECTLVGAVTTRDGGR